MENKTHPRSKAAFLAQCFPVPGGDNAAGKRPEQLFPHENIDWQEILYTYKAKSSKAAPKNTQQRYQEHFLWENKACLSNIHTDTFQPIATCFFLLPVPTERQNFVLFWWFLCFPLGQLPPPFPHCSKHKMKAKGKVEKRRGIILFLPEGPPTRKIGGTGGLPTPWSSLPHTSYSFPDPLQ